MAGHSKWANIQHRKNRQDARKAKVFTKIAREITVSARLGGVDPGANPRLRAAVLAARGVNMPMDNIQRALDKGSGAAGAEVIEEAIYEGYAPGGVAVLVEGMTDNRNRTTSEIRNIFSRSGGSLAESGAVSWQFERVGLVTVSKEGMSEVAATELALECGGEDLEDGGEEWVISTPGIELHQVSEAIEGRGVEVLNAELILSPSTAVDLDPDTAGKVAALIERLEDHDDVQKVWSNADPDVLAAVEE